MKWMKWMKWMKYIFDNNISINISINIKINKQTNLHDIIWSDKQKIIPYHIILN